jgi:thiamine-monophosphate kinase
MFNTHGGPDATFRAHQVMGPGVEFDTIRMLLSRWGDLAVDIGDDAAVLPRIASGHRVVSTDACVEDVHFRRAWLTPYEVGHRAAAAALSDLAAMGARAECVLVAFVVPPAWEADLAQVADGIGSQVRAAGARIVGGNLSRGGTFAITLTVIGVAERVVSRAGAAVGDLVLVTGTLGGPGAALRAWERGGAPEAWARSRFAAPTARLAAGQALANPLLTVDRECEGLAAEATVPTEPTTPELSTPPVETVPVTGPTSPTATAMNPTAPTDEILTIANSPEFAAILTEGECSDSIRNFAATYKGRVIEFDGHIAYVGPHPGRETRWDFVLAPGEAPGVVGPVFKFEDVGRADLNLTNENIPGLNTGQNLHIIAKVVDYNATQCLFFLDPVSTGVR